MLVLLLVALHLQCLYAKYYLVKTDGKAASVHRNHKQGVSSSKTSKTDIVKHKDKRTGRARGRNKALAKQGKYQIMILIIILNEKIHESYLYPIISMT